MYVKLIFKLSLTNVFSSVVSLFTDRTSLGTATCLCHVVLYERCSTVSLASALTSQRKHFISVITRQAMCLWRNIEIRSCNHCGSVKAVSVKSYECVSIALFFSMKFLCALFHCHLCSVRLYHVLTLYLTYETIFEKQKLLNIKFVFYFLYIFMKYFSF